MKHGGLALAATVLVGGILGGLLGDILRSSPPAQAQNTADIGRFELRNYIKPHHCENAAIKKNCDLYPAFQTAMAACHTLRKKQAGGAVNSTGCVYVVPEGTHRLTRTVELCRQNHIVGEGTWNTGASTKIVSDSTAFWIRSGSYCQGAGLGFAANTTIVGVSLEGSATALANAYTNCTGTDTCGVFGVLADSTFTLEHMSMRSYTQGVHAFCDVGLFGNNCNVWSMSHIWVSDTTHSGIFIRGNDANSGIATHINVSEACTDGTTWNGREIWGNPSPQQDCAGVHDRSFLGNTWVGVHTSTIIDTVANPDVPFHAYMFDGSLNRSVCLGCYGEFDSAPIEAPGLTTFIGADAEHTPYGSAGGGYLHIDGTTLTPFKVNNYIDTGNMLQIYLGTFAGSAFTVKPVDTNQAQTEAHFHVRYNPSRKSYSLGASDAEGSSSQSMSLAADSTSTDGAFTGEVRLNCDYWVDPGANDTPPIAADECTPP